MEPVKPELLVFGEISRQGSEKTVTGAAGDSTVALSGPLVLDTPAEEINNKSYNNQSQVFIRYQVLGQFLLGGSAGYDCSLRVR